MKSARSAYIVALAATGIMALAPRAMAEPGDTGAGTITSAPQIQGALLVAPPTIYLSGAQLAADKKEPVRTKSHAKKKTGKKKAHKA